MANTSGEFETDFYDYLPSPRQTRRLRQSGQGPVGSKPHDRRPIHVTDDWPEIVPITEQEIRIIEGHFADLLDELLGPRL